MSCDLLTRIRAQRTLQQVLTLTPRPCAFRAPYGTAVVHLNTHTGRVGEWRVTRLDAAGQPDGHMEAGTFDEALTLARTDGADLADEVKP